MSEPSFLGMVRRGDDFVWEVDTVSHEGVREIMVRQDALHEEADNRILVHE